MNAPIAPPPATTPKTSAAGFVAGASSTTPRTIDSHISEWLKEALSGDSYGAKSSAEAARRHGFTSSANSRYADFLEAFRAAPALTAYYTEKYPSSYFLPWAALRSVIQSLQLWCDLPEHYMGAVPPEQLPWLDLFALDSADSALGLEILELVGTEPQYKERWEQLVQDCMTDRDAVIWHHQSERHVDRDRTPDSILDQHQTTVRAHLKQFQSQFFVLAPPEAFKTEMDFCERFRRLMKQPVTRPTIPPDDPLVVRFVQGGALVVAAWGDEAAELNARVAALNI